jgi:anti-sigma B factor antagonist
MSVKIENRNGLSICRIEGEIDINSSPAVKKSFDKLIGAKAPRIIVNLSKVTYVDSSGLATLVDILKNMRSYGGRLRLTNLSSKVRSLFEITKLEKLFEIMADEAEASDRFL